MNKYVGYCQDAAIISARLPSVIFYEFVSMIYECIPHIEEVLLMIGFFSTFSPTYFITSTPWIRTNFDDFYSKGEFRCIQIKTC